MDWLGKKQYLLVGFGMGIVIWLLLYGMVLHNLPQTKEIAPKDPLTTIISFIGHEIYGIITAWVYIKIGNRKAVESWES